MIASKLEKLPPTADVAIVGAGFGGLAAALRLSELGARVVVCEALSYPGGCASTFTRGRYQFEAGATLFSGLGEGQLFRRWIDGYGLDVDVDWLDPVVELRTPSRRFPVPARRDELIAKFADASGAPREAIHRFFDLQRSVADVLWRLMDEPDLLPPFGVAAAWSHVRRLGDYLPLLPLLGKSLESVLQRLGVSGVAPLRIYLRALCQITVQCPPEQAEALFALGTMDYYFRGTGHVRGGIGKLAWGLIDAIRSRGGTVVLANEVSGFTPNNGGWSLRTRRGEMEARAVIANVLPHNLWDLTKSTPGELARADELARDVETGWGACMLYRVVRRPGEASAGPHHLELIHDPSAAFVEGNHLFCSFSGEGDGDRAPDGYRTLTASTHVPVSKLREMTLDEQARYIETVQETMRATLRTAAPEWEYEVIDEMTASPRTFQRFTKRYVGYVGGIPRRVGFKNYRGFMPRAVLPGLYCVGDTVFPGQSTLATAIGGVKVAERVARSI